MSKQHPGLIMNNVDPMVKTSGITNFGRDPVQGDIPCQIKPKKNA